MWVNTDPEPQFLPATRLTEKASSLLSGSSPIPSLNVYSCTKREERKACWKMDSDLVLNEVTESEGLPLEATKLEMKQDFTFYKNLSEICYRKL